MLRLARPEDPGFVRALCASPGNARLLDPPGAGEIEDALADDLLFIWEEGGAPVGFALMVEWVPAVHSIRAFAVARRGAGRPFLAALLAHLFDGRGAHRIGLDVTADNARAIDFWTRAGFVREGVWREGWNRPGEGWVDCVFMAMLAREWRSRAEQAMPCGPTGGILDCP